MAQPIVKWAGGKTKLLPELVRRVPKKMGTYVEPFAGGAALFFSLADEKRWERAILCDRNEELIACYRAVRDEVEALIEALGAFRYDRDLFYEVRAQNTRKLSDVKRGARLIFLNKTCFNGLWRVNSKGEFNVPFGRYANPRILDAPRLRAASRALSGVDLVVGDFADVTRACGRGDFVYFDPPYVPLSRTANFTAYASDGFSRDDQERLVAEVRALRSRGARAMLSNADTEETRALYKGLSTEVVYALRRISRDAEGRGMLSELLVTTWPHTSERRGERRKALRA